MPSIKILSAAVALAFAGIGAVSLPAAAQADDVATMQQGLDMLRTALQNALPAYGVEVDVSTLTLEQVAEVMAAIEDNRDNQEGVARALEVALNSDR
jgi:hypothetical protein